MNAITHALSNALLHFLWQGILAAFVLWLGIELLRNRSAKARYLLGCAVLVTLAAAPIVTAFLAYARPVPSHVIAGLRIAISSGILATAAPAKINWFALLQKWALPMWACGVLVCSLRLLWGCRQVSAMRRRGQPASDAVSEVVTRLARRMKIDWPVRVLISTLAEGPSVVGWLRPVILVPAATLLGLTPEQLEAVFAHELAHIRRYDYLVNVLQMVVESVFFYHPAVWWISSRIRHERELCCDDIAVEACGDPVSYARALTTLARIQLHPSLALGVQDGPLSYRVKRLLGAEPRASGPSQASALIAIGLVLIGFGVNLKIARAQTVHDQAGVSVDLHGARVVQREPVTYPPAAQSKGSQGNVTVQVTVDESGNVTDAHVLAGPQEFRKTVLQSVLTWHFAPDGAESTRQVSVDFQKAAAPVQAPDRPAFAPPVQAAAANSNNPPFECEVVPVWTNTYAAGLKIELSCEGPRQGVEVRIPLQRTSDRFSMAVDTAEAFVPGVAYVIRETTEGYFTLTTEDQVRAQIQKQQDRISALRLQQTGASEQGAAQLEEVIHRAQFDLSKLQADLDGGRRYVGRALDSIGTEGFSDAERAVLLSRLPIQEGYALTRQTLNAAFQAVQRYDPRASATLQATPDGKLAFNVVLPRPAQ